MTSTSVGVSDDKFTSAPIVPGYPGVKSVEDGCEGDNKARPTLPPYWVSKMSPSLGLATLHSVKPPTENGLPVATLINWLPDSDHFHSWLSDPVNDHISSLVGES